MELEQDLDAAEAREEKWQMKFNLTKCRVLTITKKWKQIESNYILHRQTLQRVSSVKYLGVDVTEHLHWGNISRLSRLKRTRPVISFIETWMGSQQPSQELDSPVEIVNVASDPQQRNLKPDIEMDHRRGARRICHLWEIGWTCALDTCHFLDEAVVYFLW